ncbi:acetyl-CoA hydrolase/transferase C-terminal domain-containing protein [Filibacter tadaridae]|uniref:Succinyl-CoA:coenzyme A transferase n=1 Tax=Filibacter tadaridae TaxID=2483811 RepID=A0A3P5WZQ2_9BACL|nr:acetyl-CoA hydrolase/transferase C-terminal domain-containing protein [Filibacter tadaridae]VDC21069.1 Succinyl-CoA:coenzyme A transferase [Filibacter tadaridae]
MSKRLNTEELLDLIAEEADIIVPIANGEPHRLLDILEENYLKLRNVKIHQMLALKERNYILGEMNNHLSHVSYFLSGATRKAYYEGKVELVPNLFHEVPRMLKKVTKMSMVMAVASPMDAHGYFSLGTQADYVSEFIGNVPFVLEVNQHMPRTFGENQIHISQIAGFIENDVLLSEEKAPLISEKDKEIARFVTSDIKNGDSLQIGIGSIPNAVMGMLKDHRDLGIHTEMLTDGIVDLVASGAVTGRNKCTHKGKIVATFAFGTQRLYDFVHNNPSVEFLPVSVVNDPREIAKEERIVSINATTEVDLYGQCASETIGGRYYSSTGGQADFARGAHLAKYGKGYICMHSTVKNDTISRIKFQLTPGSVVSTSKNDVDNIVTEYGIARLHGKSLANRAKALINIAHPAFREELLFEAKKNGIL